jgi:hypothetical protein
MPVPAVGCDARLLAILAIRLLSARLPLPVGRPRSRMSRPRRRAGACLDCLAVRGREGATGGGVAAGCDWSEAVICVSWSASRRSGSITSKTIR